MNHSFPRTRDADWLARESTRWVDEGVIAPEQRDAILARYAGDGRDPLFSGSLLTWLAWLVAGCGIILLVARNWESLPQAAKVGGLRWPPARRWPHGSGGRTLVRHDGEELCRSRVDRF